MFSIASILMVLSAAAQVDSINQRIFLIGDAGGLLGDRQPVVDWLQKQVDWNDPKNVALFLGDNVYPEGLPMEGEPTYEASKKVLDAQISLVKGKKAKAYFVLGNHDWKGGKLGGWQQALNQQNYIGSLGYNNVEVWPKDGCPGPIPVELSDKVVAVFIDSQWFLYVHEKPGPGSTCNSRTVEEFATELREIALSHPNQLMVIVMHHPLYSFGPHGGDYGWKEHLFPFTAVNPKLYIPLPVIGSIYPISRGVFGSLQDLRHPLYQNMAREIEHVMKDHPGSVQVAGHEHSLQMIVQNKLPFIVSGSGINLSRLKTNRKGTLLFSDVSTYGFVMLEVRNSGAISASFYNINSTDLLHPNYVHQLDSVKVVQEAVAKDSIPTLRDSVLIAANPELRAGGLKRLFMGENYRAEWTTPVKVPVFDIGKEQGGFKPEKQGGGKQTKSLRLSDKNGKEWALRSVQKYPEAAIPPDLRSPLAVDIVEDGISASYPYASLSTPVLADAAKVPYLRRKLVYIPDDPRLGRFRSTFKNTLAVLEEREPADIEKTDNTDEVVLKLAKDNDNHVDQKQVLRARLVDNFYMDFDRHEDQWRWATRDTGKGKIYFALPRDQDQAFYTNQGAIPWFAQKPWLVPELQGIRAHAKDINTFNRAARNFDRFFLNELDEQDWSLQVDTLLAAMTDSVINRAMMQQPKEVRGFDANKLAEILKKRRQYFRDDMMGYYRFISRQVNIVGTNQRELFTIDKQGDGRVHVTLNKITKEGEVSSKIYDRLFEPSVTKELRIYGLQDDDSFVVRGSASPMLIRIVGGSGKDHFVNEGTGGKLIVYDVTFEENTFSGNGSGLRKRLSKDPRNNEYNRIFFKYNIFHPGLSFAYNADDGLFLGARVQYTSHGFRKEPYAAQHTLSGGHALRTSSWYFKYMGEFIKAIGTSDIVLRADVRAPVNVTNFFGLGNETKLDKDNPEGIRYYRTRYNIANASAFLRRQMQSWMRINIGPTFQTFRLQEEENKNKFVSNTALSGLDPATLYKARSYVGGEFLLDINSRNDQVLPTRGFLLDAGVRSLFGVNGNSKDLTQLHWDMSVVTSFVTNPRYVIATRLGWYHNIGTYEFPQAQYLSGTENLRGYRRNRFAGRTMAFNNSEIRIKLGDFTTYLFPGSAGFLLFNDVGRVWSPSESSTKWHDGYGAGIWIAPIQRFVITASVARSEEEKALPYVTFGFQF